MSFTTCLVIAIGGAIGTLARYVISVLALPVSRELPWGTIGINVTGSFVIGLFGTLTLAQGRYPLSGNIRSFIMVGRPVWRLHHLLCVQSTDARPDPRRRDPARGNQHHRFSGIVRRCPVALAHLTAAHFNGGATQIAQMPIEEEG